MFVIFIVFLGFRGFYVRFYLKIFCRVFLENFIDKDNFLKVLKNNINVWFSIFYGII